jgi:hypothetical protein
MCSLSEESSPKRKSWPPLPTVTGERTAQGMELTVANVSTVNVTGNVSGLGADAHSAVATAGPIAVQHAGPLGAPQATGAAAASTTGTLAKEMIATGTAAIGPAATPVTGAAAASTTGTLAKGIVATGTAAIGPAATPPSPALYVATTTTAVVGAETMAVRIIPVTVDAVWIVLVLMDKAETLARGVDSVLGTVATACVILAIVRTWMVLLKPSARSTQVMSAVGIITGENVTFVTVSSRRRT